MPRCSTSLCENIYIELLSVRHHHAQDSVFTESLHTQRRHYRTVLAARKTYDSLAALAFFLEPVSYPLYDIVLFDFSALNISITLIYLYSARYQTGGKFNGMKTLLSYQHFHFYASYLQSSGSGGIIV